MKFTSITGNGNGLHSTNGHSRWWQVWKRGPQQELDLAAYRRLALQLHHGLPRTGETPRSVLLVTPNEARYWAAGCVTLASCMAEELQRPVLLVDASDGGELSEMMGSPSSRGLADFLLDPTQPFRDLVLATSQPDVSFLSRGSAQNSASCASPEVARDVLTRSATEWDFVVVAGGPVLKNSLPLAMAPYVGRVLLLVIENSTHLDDIDAAQHVLEQCKAQNMSLVLTHLDGPAR